MVAFCHYQPYVVAKLLANAQDRGMTDGSYAFHTFAEYATQAVLEPWSTWNTLNISDMDYRMQAFYAVNLVNSTINFCILKVSCATSSQHLNLSKSLEANSFKCMVSDQRKQFHFNIVHQFTCLFGT